MNRIFEEILYLNVVGSLGIPVMLFFRRLTKKYSYKYSYYGWFAVFLSFCIPFRIPLPVLTGSGLPDNTIKGGSALILQTAEYFRYGEYRQMTVAPVPAQSNFSVFASCRKLYFVGVILFMAWNVLLLWRFQKKLRSRQEIGENIYALNQSGSPFVFGILHPAIYLTRGFTAEDSDILRHEQAHLRHRDNLWKPLFVLLTCIHWFNPLWHLSVFLWENDAENYCDEETVCKMELAERKEYAKMLLLHTQVLDRNFSVSLNNQHFMRERILNIMKKKNLTTTISHVFLGVFAFSLVTAFTLPRITPTAAAQEPSGSALTVSVPETADFFETNEISEPNSASTAQPEPAKEADEPLMEFHMPLDGRISAPYSAAEEFRPAHEGMDIAAEAGTVILAAAAGTVSDCGYNAKCGNYIILDHENGYQTHYYHCSQISVQSGDSVAMQQPIATVGSTGMATGPHLHFAVSQNGVFLDINEAFAD